MTWIFSPSLHTKPLLILANNISTYVRTHVRTRTYYNILQYEEGEFHTYPAPFNPFQRTLQRKKKKKKFN